MFSEYTPPIMHTHLIKTDKNFSKNLMRGANIIFSLSFLGIAFFYEFFSKITRDKW